MSIFKKMLITLSLLASCSVSAQTMSLKDEFSKKIKAANTTEPLGSDLFGNNTNPSTGKTEFSNIDISLPGNSKLSVQLGRRLNIDHRYMPEELGGLGNWDMDIPYIEGTFSKNVGWAISSTGDNRYQRCSTATPPAVEGVRFSAQEAWHGYKIHVPGILDETMLAENNAYPDPTDGLSYPWILKSMGRVGCLPTVKNGYSGEGYFLKTTDGTKYYFDYPVERKAATLYKAQKGVPGYSMERKRIFMLATRIEDRFGNFVNYGYSNGRLVNVVANDGRRIDINYGAITTGGVQSGTITATANARIWSYVIQNGQLLEVKQPDGQSWKYSPFGSHTTFVETDPNQEPLALAYFSPEAFCEDSFDSRYSGNLNMNVTHPSGATGQFTFEGSHFYRSQVPYQCTIDFFDHQARINLNDMRTNQRRDGIDWAVVFSIMDTNGDGTISSGEISLGNLDAAIALATDQGPIIEGPSFVEVSGHARIIIPNYFALFSLKNLAISGTGISSQITQYNYNSEVYPYCNQYDSQTGQVWSVSCSLPDPCPEYGCTDGIGRWVETTLPSGEKVRKRYGVLFGKNEGELLSEEVLNSAGAVLRRVDYRYMQDSELAGQPFAGQVGVNFSSDPSEARVRPIVSSKVLQDGIVFKNIVTGFNNFAQPISTTRSSSLGYTRSDTTAYEHNYTKWVIGQVKSVTNTNTTPNIIVSQTNYDEVTALPLQSFSFGQLQASMTYNADGTLATMKDANNNVFNLSSYKRGVPQSIAFPDGKSVAAVVNDNGLVSSSTDQMGYAHSYGYDLMGRLTNVTYPLADSTLWNPQSLNFAVATTAAYGLPVGHWYHTASTGNGKTTTYYDAMWRPVLTRTEDTANAATRSFVVNRYDISGRLAFTSYPVDTLTGINDVLKGTYTEYDSLGRVTKVKQDSELGLLITTMEYLAGFKTKVTNPRGYSTTTSYQVFDAPDTSRPTLILQPLNVTTTIVRDVFGKPISTTCSGPKP